VALRDCPHCRSAIEPAQVLAQSLSRARCRQCSWEGPETVWVLLPKQVYADLLAAMTADVRAAIEAAATLHAFEPDDEVFIKCAPGLALDLLAVAKRSCRAAVHDVRAALFEVGFDVR